MRVFLTPPTILSLLLLLDFRRQHDLYDCTTVQPSQKTGCLPRPMLLHTCLGKTARLQYTVGCMMLPLTSYMVTVQVYMSDKCSNRDVCVVLVYHCYPFLPAIPLVGYMVKQLAEEVCGRVNGATNQHGVRLHAMGICCPTVMQSVFMVLCNLPPNRMPYNTWPFCT